MKKILILTAVFLMGTASVFAQWDCNVEWEYLQEADCQPEHLPQQNTYFIKITLDIYDVANSEQVTNPNPVKTEAITELETNFTEAQCQVKDYCDDDRSLRNISCTWRMGQCHIDKIPDSKYLQ